MKNKENEIPKEEGEIIQNSDANVNFVRILDVIRYKLKEFTIDNLVLDNKLNNSIEDNFFRDNNLTLFDETENEVFENIHPKEIKIKSIVEEYNPDLVYKLWNMLDFKEKFILFYGFNESIEKYETNEIITDFESKELGIIDFFTCCHRGFILENFNSPKSLFIVAKEILHQICKENNIILDREFVSFFEVLSYVKSLKLNYLKYNSFFISIFDRFIKTPKEIAGKIKELYSENFKIFNNKIGEIKRREAKITFVEYYKLLITNTKFRNLLQYYKINDAKFNSKESLN